MLIDAVVDDDANLFLYEEPTTIVDGTEKVAINLNRNNPESLPSGFEILLDPSSIGDNGTLLTSFRLTSSNPNTLAINKYLMSILKKNTKYLVKYRSKSAANSMTSILAFEFVKANKL